MKKHLKRKQSGLLHNAPSVMAAELADAEDSFHQGKQCSAARFGCPVSIYR